MYMCKLETWLEMHKFFLNRTLKGKAGEYQEHTEMLCLKHFIEALVARYQQN